jgi:fumarate reductase flavoprotein subunit
MAHAQQHWMVSESARRLLPGCMHSEEFCVEKFDILIVGAGAAGLPAAIFASRAGARVLLVDAAPEIGGTFHLSTGQVSAAGTRLQAAKGIADTPDEHFEDVMRISRGSVRADLVRIAVDNAADTIDWLMDNGFTPEPDHPIIHFGHEPYTKPRTYWAAEGGMAILKVLRPLAERAVRDHGLVIRTGTRMTALLGTPQQVTGARLETGGQTYDVMAEHVILASGGVSANPELYASLHNQPLYGGGYAYSRGDGLLAAGALGASIVGGEKFLPTFAGVEEPGAPGGITFMTQTYPQFRQPWEVYVDLNARRFVREDDPSVDNRERCLLAIPEMTFWAIYDQAVRERAPSFFPELSQAEIDRRFEAGGAYVRADSLEALAAGTGLPLEVLTRTLDDYSRAVREGRPDPMGREHRPLAIDTPPFYAVRHRGWSIVSFAGIAVDSELRVLNGDKAPIAGVYAVGEAIGFAATSGNSFVGGMSVTPAMTFGRLLGQRLGAAASLT